MNGFHSYYNGYITIYTSLNKNLKDNYIRQTTKILFIRKLIYFIEGKNNETIGIEYEPETTTVVF